MTEKGNTERNRDILGVKYDLKYEDRFALTSLNELEILKNVY